MSSDKTTAKRPLPPAQPNRQAARAFGQDASQLVARIREMAIATRRAANLARVPFAREAEADGVKISASRLARYEHMTERSEIDVFTLLWLMARGGYRWSDLYEPMSGTAGLTDEEADLLRAYRAALPHARPSIRQYADLMARESVRTVERPDNVHDLPRPAAHPLDDLARDQALHEAQAEVRAAKETIEEHQRQRKRPRQFYGKVTK